MSHPPVYVSFFDDSAVRHLPGTVKNQFNPRRALIPLAAKFIFLVLHA